MFRFEIQYALFFLLLLPIGLLLVWLRQQWQSKTLNNLGEHSILSRLFPDWSATREWVKAGVLLAGMAFLVVGWSNPQWGTRTEKVKAKSSDVIIALDISQSMLAEDISPNRMERAKRFSVELLKKLRGERIGLIFFAGGAYLQMPLSQDFGNAQVHIKSANPNQAGTQGTVIADALELARKTFTEDSPSQKAIILISDGENHETEAIASAKAALEEGIHLYTVGIGSEQGGIVPFTRHGQKLHRNDKDGNPITSVLNVGMLKDLAEAGGGKFYLLDQIMSALSDLDSEIDKLEKKEVEQRSFTEYNSYFQLFLFPAFLLLFLEYFISTSSNKSRSWKSIFGL